MNDSDLHDLSILEWLVQNKHQLKANDSGLYCNGVMTSWGMWRGIRYVHLQDDLGQEYIISDPFFPDNADFQVFRRFLKKVWGKIWRKTPEVPKEYKDMTHGEKIHFQFELIFNYAEKKQASDEHRAENNMAKIRQSLFKKLRGLK